MKNNVQMFTKTGEIYYSAPEILKDEEYSESVDIWTSGILLYMILSGERPFMSNY